MVYSPKNSKVKEIEEYSVLNPLTNSDSPSVKSKGARLVSAKEETNHNGRIKNHPLIKEEKRFLSLREKKFSLILIFILIKKKKDNTTS